MTLHHPNRRDLLKGATTLAAASSVAGLVGGHARPAYAKPARSDGAEQIGQALRKGVDDEVVPGVVVVGATDKGVIYEGAFGTRDMTSGLAMRPDTIFWIASMTKAVTATACMQLVEQGKLQLDQPMGKLLPELENPKVLTGFDASGAPILRPAKRPILLRHLLTHTAGFTYDQWSEPMTRYEKATEAPGIITCKNAALNVPLVFDPGDRWEYGINIDWVGKAVEAVSDQSLEIYFREHIFAPLGMTDTGFLISSKQKARLATVYIRKSDGLHATPFEMPQRPEFFMGGGGLFSTPRDYIVFLQMLLDGGTFNGVQVLKPETVALMGQNHIGELNVETLKTVAVETSHDANLFPGMVQKWGLSFDINTEPGPAGRSAGSLAWAGYFNTYFWIDPNKHVTGVIMTQILPFADPGVLKLLAEFERGLYTIAVPA
ncbi:MAG: beta-lactamase family protein [Acetobacteraceae bacterium]|nr:beta-lactamase family protein [Acetobacteraceae bacterium]